MSKKDNTNGLKLNPTEQQVLQGIAQEKSENGRRAQMLLSLAAGDDLAAAAARSDLTTNQARHWRGRFRSQRLSVFPEDLVKQHTSVRALPRHKSPGLLSSPPAAPLLQGPAPLQALPEGTAVNSAKKKSKSKEKNKKKDAGQDKGKKKSKKSRKPKKSKKGKKGKKDKKDEKDEKKGTRESKSKRKKS